MFSPDSAVFEYFGMTERASNVCGSTWPAQPCCLHERTRAPTVGVELLATSKSYCECWGSSWEPDIGKLFDNVAQGMLSLFQISTLDGWVDVREIASDSTGVHMQPVRENKSSWIFFFIFFIIVSNFLFLNIFISEVVKSFNDNLPAQEEMGNDKLMKQFETVEDTWFAMFEDDGSEEALKLETSKRLLKAWEFPNSQKHWVSGKSRIQVFATILSNDPYFERFTIILITLNCIILAMPYFGASDEYLRGLDTANTVFGVLFNLELIVHVAAKGPYHFNDRYNCFDAIIVLAADAEMISTLLRGTQAFHAVSLGRMLRLLKLIRMIKLPQLQRLIGVLYSFLPSILSIGVFLFLMVGIFAVLGMHCFGKTAYFGQYSKYANFRSIDVALLSMFGFLTGQDWDGFMRDAAVDTDSCVVDPPYNASFCGFSDHLGCIPLNGCGSMGMYPFMLFYMLVVSTCCLTLFTAVIIDGLTMYAEDTLFDKIDATTRDQFVDCWLKYDKGETGFISVRNLEKLAIDGANPFKLFVSLTQRTAADVVKSFCSGASSAEGAPYPKDPKALREAIDTLPFSVKMRKGLLFTEVFKILVLSADSELVALTATMRMEIETRRLAGRQWLSLKEHNAAWVIWRACRKFMNARRDSKLVQNPSMLRTLSNAGAETLSAIAEMPKYFSDSMVHSFTDFYTIGFGSDDGGSLDNSEAKA